MASRIHPSRHARAFVPRLLFGAVLVLGALLFSTSIARAAIGEGGNCTAASMFIVAHEDDTLLFQTPSIQQTMESGRCTRCVFLTAGDAGKGASYWHSREEGVEAAYALMAGVEDEWSSATVTAAGHTLVLRTLVEEPRITIVFIRLPDGGYPAGTGYAADGNQSLMKLWNGGNKGTPSESSITALDGSNTFTYAGLTETLTALMNSYEPQLVATQDFTETFSGEDHKDHVATAYFARLAQRSYTKPHQLVGYEDYPDSSRPANVFEAQLEAKKSAFYLYGLYDEGACSEEATCDALEYGNWLRRQYVVGKETTGVVANAGYAQTVEPGALVKLSGAESSDASGKSLTYSWTQTSGPTVTLTGAMTATPSFLAPSSGTATFSLTVREGVTASSTDSVTVKVQAAAPEPIAVAGSPQSVAAGSAVQLDGSGSYDPEGGALTYRWTQVSGPVVSLSGATTAKPTFTAPALATELVFSLTVSNGSRTSAPSTVAVEVEPAAGTADVALLAAAAASSEAPEQGAENAIDGVVSGYPVNPYAEWSSEGEKAGAWLKLAWTRSYTLDHVVLYDRPNTDDQVTSGTLTFSDGSTVSFGALPNEGSTGLTVSFPARATTSLKVTITGVSSSTVNVGLSEVEAWGAPTEMIPVATVSAAPTAAAGSTVQLDGSGSSDAEGLPLTYNWTQTGGPSVTLAGAATSKPTFTAPAGPASLTFSLTVSDGVHTSLPANVTIEVQAAPGTADVALLAAAAASSEAPEQGAENAIDGVVSGYPVNPYAEWSSEGEKAGAWLKLAWTKSYTLDHVVLYDRPNTDDQVTSGTLTFSDGSTVSFGALPNEGSTGLTVSFPARATTSLKVTITGVSSSTVNVGLSEVEAWGSATPGQTTVKPTFTSSNAAPFTVGTAGTFTVATTGTPTATLKSSGTLPSGLTFTAKSDGTATISGTPSSTAAGAGSSKTYPITLTATNSSGSTTQTLTITVTNNEPKPVKPSFTSSNAAPFTVGTAGTFTVATTGTPTATLKSSGTLPSGLTFTAKSDGTATISGTPSSSAAGAGSSKTYPVTLTATNSSGSTTQTLTITVTNNEPKPVKPSFTSSNAAPFTVGTAGTFTVATTGTPTATLKSSGTLPSGLTFTAKSDGTATISGTPSSSAAGAGSSKTYPVTLTATNSSGSTTQTLTITVTNNEPKPVKPSFTTPSTRTATINKAVEIPIEASGTPAPTLSLSGTPPRGLTFKATAAGKAVLTGTPTVTGTTHLTVIATNSAGTTSQSLTITVSR